MKTLKTKIIDLMEDGKSRHYTDIALRLKANIVSVKRVLAQLKNQGLLIQPIVTYKKKKAGYYQMEEITIRYSEPDAGPINPKFGIWQQRRK